MVTVLINRENLTRKELDERERIAATNWLETRFEMLWERYGIVEEFEYCGEELRFWNCYIPDQFRPRGYRYPGKMFDIKIDRRERRE